MESTFEKCVERKMTPRGVTEISCKLGLWATSGRDAEKVEAEARRYWIQYFKDGEYSKLLKS